MKSLIMCVALLSSGVVNAQQVNDREFAENICNKNGNFGVQVVQYHVNNPNSTADTLNQEVQKLYAGMPGDKRPNATVREMQETTVMLLYKKNVRDKDEGYMWAKKLCMMGLHQQ